MIPVKLQAHNRKTVAELLRRRGITPTHQRIEIAHALFARREHLSADQILALVNSRYAEASKATVYNTLKLFLEKKLIRVLVLPPLPAGTVAEGVDIIIRTRSNP